ncbi:MAG TPA: quercetin 2,3-dioxygenase, partial [Acidimicrobiales bacterium]|nr:quercetin 2,3-dioxygenase [Acidimicrobiales bacterium]
GKKLWVADELVTVVVSGDATGGAYALTDSTVPAGGEAPPHVHHREVEALWVLEGALEIVAGGETFEASAGSFVHLPRGVPHAYRNVGTAPARFLTLMVPAGLEKFFEEVGKPGEDPSSPPPFGEADLRRLLAAAPEYGVEILPPPGQ